MPGFILTPSNQCHLTRDEKDALQGTYGDPSDTNRYLTDSDSRVQPSSPTNTGTMSASDYVLLHSLSSGGLGGLTDLQMGMLAMQAKNILEDNTDQQDTYPAITQYLNLETFFDGVLPSGSAKVNLSRNNHKLELAPDTAATSIQLLDDCTSTASWSTYNPDGGTGFSYSVEYWNLVGQDALKQSYINSAFLNNDWYMILANYRRHTISDTYGLLLTTKVTSDNNPITVGWDNSYSRCIKQNIADNAFYEDFWAPFGTSETVSDMTIGMYTMFPASPMYAWFSNIRAAVGANPVMVPSGQYVSPTYTYTDNIKDLILVSSIEIRDHQDGTIQLDVSLDGGAHWKNNVAKDTMLNVTADLPASDTGPWNNLKNLKMRYTINRGSYTELGRGPVLSGIASVVRTEL